MATLDSIAALTLDQAAQLPLDFFGDEDPISFQDFVAEAGNVYYGHFNLYNADGSAGTGSNMSISLFRNGALDSSNSTAATASIASTATAGLYTFQVTTTGYTSGDQISSIVTATVQGVSFNFTPASGQFVVGAGVTLNVTPGLVGAASVGNVYSGDFAATQNSQFTVTFPVVDNQGNAISLTSDGSLVMPFADPNNGNATAFTATIGGSHASLSVAGTGGNMVTVTLDATTTATVANLNWILGDESTKRIYATGTLRINPFTTW